MAAEPGVEVDGRQRRPHRNRVGMVLCTREIAGGTLANKRPSLEQLTLSQLTKLLQVREWWRIGAALFTLLVGAFLFGKNYDHWVHDARSSAVANHPTREMITIRAGVGVPILGGKVVLSLDPYPDGESQRLRLSGVEGWSTSPKGPFLREEGVDGPVYRPGSKTYFRIGNEIVWSIATLAVRADEIDIEVSGPIEQ